MEYVYKVQVQKSNGYTWIYFISFYLYHHNLVLFRLGFGLRGQKNDLMSKTQGKGQTNVDILWGKQGGQVGQTLTFGDEWVAGL